VRLCYKSENGAAAAKHAEDLCMSAPSHILLVRPWTSGAERLRTSLRAAGLSVRISRVDFPAALHAALTWGSFDVILFDPTTPNITHELVSNALRDRNLSTPVVVLTSDDIGTVVAAHLVARRN
jgi:CheY-like chemotaxis protein